MESPEKKIHVAVGFYPNGDIQINHVRDADLAANIKYNRLFRPGRVYFVDGEYVCGGLLSQPEQDAFLEKCRERLAAMNLPEPLTHSWPYR